MRNLLSSCNRDHCAECKDVGGLLAFTCADRVCTAKNLQGGTVQFCQCVREHILCLRGHYESLSAKCDPLNVLEGSYATHCPELCHSLHMFQSTTTAATAAAAATPVTTTSVGVALEVRIPPLSVLAVLVVGSWWLFAIRCADDR
jgi:hypothetical protein